MKINIGSLMIVFLFATMFVFANPQLINGQEKGEIKKTKEITSAQNAVATIPFELSGNHIYINVSVNDSSAPLSFILDTGAATSVISLKQMEALKLESTGKVPLRGAGGDVFGQLLKDANLTVVGIKNFKTPLMVAIPLANLEELAGHKIDGVLGHEFFRSFPVKIDYQKSLIEIFENENFEYKGTGEIIPMRLTGRHPHINAKFYLDDKQEFEGDFIIDNGSAQSLTLTTEFINNNKLLEKISPVIEMPMMGAGVGGEIKGSIARVKKLQIGNFEINKPLTTLSQSTNGALAGSQNNIGIIGTGILKRFNVIFDYKNKQMILEETSSSFQEEKFNMSGILVRKVKEDYKIFGLVKNSPAVEAGLEVDDVLLKINGVSANEFSLEQIQEKFKTEGKLKLEIKRADKILKKELKLRKLI